MLRSMSIILLALLVILSCSKTTEPTYNNSSDDDSPAQHPTGYFMGKVVKSGTGGNVFIEGAVVAIAQKSDITDELGWYWIENIPTGQYTVSVVKSGYDTFTKKVTIYEDQNNGIIVELTPSK